MEPTIHHGTGYVQPINRSQWHNTHIYRSNDHNTVLGGLWVAPGVTNSNLYSMVEILCTLTGSFNLEDSSQRVVERDAEQLQPGNYYIVAKGSVSVTSEFPLLRTPAVDYETQVESFFTSVCNRDRRCVITARPAVLDGVTYWETFKATYVFPAAYKQFWEKSDSQHGIEFPLVSQFQETINSVQNGILLTRDIHAQFVTYGLSIDPQDNYKIICFNPLASSYAISGAHLDRRFLDDPLRPPDELLSWHFRQAVLANMKGVPCLDQDVPVCSDVEAEVISYQKFPGK